ncbi:MAG: hypothetical protein AMXMBFR84_30570 [Candidatus Hydrogenedentota bacterium]
MHFCLTIVSAIALLQVESGQTPASTQAAIDPAILEKAKAIVAEYTPQKMVWVEGFKNGLRVSGITLPEESDGAPQGGMTVRVSLPPWFESDRLLGTVTLNKPLTIRLLWSIDPTPQPSPRNGAYAVRLAQHDGYARLLQPNPVNVDTAGLNYGDVFWTDHTLPPMNVSPAGLYNVIVSNNTSPTQNIPLGQVLVPPVPEPQPEVVEKLKTLYPQGEVLSSDHVVLSRWFGIAVPNPKPGFQARSIVIISSADWIEELPNETVIAEVTVKDSAGKSLKRNLRLGKETASTWYNYHVRGNLQHEMAPVAWSWEQNVETVNFEANVYTGQFELEEGFGPLQSVEVTYAAESGLLRIRGMAMLP